MKKKKKIIILGLIAGLVFFLRSDFLNIKRVDCQFNGSLCQPEVWWDLMSAAIGKNILFLSTKNLTLQVQKKYPNLKSLKISKKFPHELIVKIEKRNAQAIVKADEEFFVIDDQGFVLEKSKIRAEIKKDLPVILIDSFSQTEVAWTANLLEKIKFYLFTPQETRIVSPRNIEVRLDKDLLVIFSSQKKMDFQLDSLQFIFSRSKIEGRTIKKIDLRFDKPVVVYE